MKEVETSIELVLGKEKVKGQGTCGITVRVSVGLLRLSQLPHAAVA